MSNNLSRPIGSRFTYNGVELEVVENTHGSDGYCKGCYFEEKCDSVSFVIRGFCSNFTRTDCRDVIFRRCCHE